MDNFQAREFTKQYSGTFCGFINLETKQTDVFFISDVFQNEDSIWQASVRYLDSNKKIILQKNISLFKYTVLPHPERQLVDFLGTTFLYSREPKRQWQRGISSSNSSLKNILAPFYNALEVPMGLYTNIFNPIMMSLPIAEALYLKPNSLSFEQVIKSLKESDNLSCKIDSKYFIAICPNKDFQFVLFRNKTPLAFYNEVKDVFKVIKSVYNQELSDFCFRNNLKSILIGEEYE